MSHGAGEVQSSVDGRNQRLTCRSPASCAFWLSLQDFVHREGLLLLTTRGGCQLESVCHILLFLLVWSHIISTFSPDKCAGCLHAPSTANVPATAPFFPSALTSWTRSLRFGWSFPRAHTTTHGCADCRLSKSLGHKSGRIPLRWVSTSSKECIQTRHLSSRLSASLVVKGLLDFSLIFVLSSLSPCCVASWEFTRSLAGASMSLLDSGGPSWKYQKQLASKCQH